jgi:16S rRNA (adenine1518-N6/adenine1519-N6)-dimethyltransferase
MKEISPKKHLGQNFLASQRIKERIIETAEINSEDIILEIGPGTGVLTEELIKRAKEVIAIEKDDEMADLLESKFTGNKNLKIIRGDILEIKISNIIKETRLRSDELRRGEGEFKVVANLPYYIATVVIRKLLEEYPFPKEMILMVQKEVGQRICAKPPEMSLLAASVQFYAKPKIAFYVPRESFWPKPKVDSVVIKITDIIEKSDPKREKTFNDLFFKILKAGFSHPRKQLAKNFSQELDFERGRINQWLGENRINPEQRAETLKVEEWEKLATGFPLSRE